MAIGSIRCASPASDRVLADHRRITALARELAQTTDLAPLANRLQQLRSQLGAHFRVEEESGGLFEGLRTASPNLVSRIDQLQHEHAALLATLDGLVRRTLDLLAQGDALFEDVRVLTHRLARHEADEDAVLHDSVNVDLGRGA